MVLDLFKCNFVKVNLIGAKSQNNRDIAYYLSNMYFSTGNKITVNKIIIKKYMY